MGRKRTAVVESAAARAAGVLSASAERLTELGHPLLDSASTAAEAAADRLVEVGHSTVEHAADAARSAGARLGEIGHIAPDSAAAAGAAARERLAAALESTAAVVRPTRPRHRVRKLLLGIAGVGAVVAAVKVVRGRGGNGLTPAAPEPAPPPVRRHEEHITIHPAPVEGGAEPASSIEDPVPTPEVEGENGAATEPTTTGQAYGLATNGVVAGRSTGGESTGEEAAPG